MQLIKQLKIYLNNVLKPPHMRGGFFFKTVEKGMKGEDYYDKGTYNSCFKYLHLE